MASSFGWKCCVGAVWGVLVRLKDLHPSAGRDPRDQPPVNRHRRQLVTRRTARTAATGPAANATRAKGQDVAPTSVGTSHRASEAPRGRPGPGRGTRSSPAAATAPVRPGAQISTSVSPAPPTTRPRVHHPVPDCCPVSVDHSRSERVGSRGRPAFTGRHGRRVSMAQRRLPSHARWGIITSARRSR